MWPTGGPPVGLRRGAARGAGRYLTRTARARLEVYTVAPQLAAAAGIEYAGMVTRAYIWTRLIAPDIVGGQVAW